MVAVAVLVVVGTAGEERSVVGSFSSLSSSSSSLMALAEEEDISPKLSSGGIWSNSS